MKRIIIAFALALVGVVAFAGRPYVGAETGLGVNSASEVMWNVNAVIGYAIPYEGVVWSPELMLGHSLIREELDMLWDNPSTTTFYPSHTSYDAYYHVSSNFQAGFRMNLSFRLHNKLWFYTAPNVHYMAGGCDLNRHWGFSWLAGFKYQWKNYFFRISYNQQVTTTFRQRLNPVTLGVEYYF